MRVFRLEHREARVGPFRRIEGQLAYDATLASDGSGFVDGSLADGPGPADRVEDDTELSEFWLDQPREKQNKYFFAFKSIAAYRAWFRHGPGRTALKDIDFVLAEYEVSENDILRGTCQLAFVRDEAELVADHLPTKRYRSKPR